MAELFSSSHLSGILLLCHYIYIATRATLLQNMVEMLIGSQANYEIKTKHGYLVNDLPQGTFLFSPCTRISAVSQSLFQRTVFHGHVT